MSGLEFVQGLVTGALPLNSMADTLGYDIVEASSGRAAISAEPTAAHLNPAGTVQGGLAAALLDSCMGLAVHSTLDKGFGQTTLDRLTDAEGRILAHGTTTCLIFEY